MGFKYNFQVRYKGIASAYGTDQAGYRGSWISAVCSHFADACMHYGLTHDECQGEAKSSNFANLYLTAMCYARSRIILIQTNWKGTFPKKKQV